MTFQRPKLEPPFGEKRVLMHSCCAPCSGDILQTLVESGLSVTVFFYNPNIHPRREYEIRKEENKKFCLKNGVPFVDADYDTRNWFAKTKGLEWEPERGARCTVCFDLRFERTADFAVQHGFRVFTSSLGISRWKDMNQINACGVRAAERRGLIYWTYNWRKQGGSDRMIALAKKENFYQQQYCGCVYSLRDTNAHRARQGRPRIEIGKNYYGLFPETPNPAFPAETP